jgi:hypothetical protein
LKSLALVLTMVLPVAVATTGPGLIPTRQGPGAVARVDSVLVPIFRDFAAADWRTREAAFYRLVHLGGEDAGYLPRPLGQVLVQYRDQANQIHLQLIALLLEEDYAAYHPPAGLGHWSEEYMNYYGDTIEAVGVLGDPRAVAALAGAIETGGNATGPLASFGGVALPIVLGKFHGKRRLSHYAALGVMARMLLPMNRSLLKPGDLAQIGEAMLEGARDRDADVREIAMRGLGDLGDRTNCAVIASHLASSEVEKVRGGAAAAEKALGCRQ